MRQKTISAIMAHAAAEYPRESCGVVAQKAVLSVTFRAAIWQQNRQSIFIFHRRIMRPQKTGER